MRPLYLLLAVACIFGGTTCDAVSQATPGNATQEVHPAIAEQKLTPKTVISPLIDVQGSVVDVSGKPAKQIPVYIAFDHMWKRPGTVPSVATDEDGRFSTQLPSGRYQLCLAWMLPPDCSDLFLTPDQHSITVSLRFRGSDRRDGSIDLLRARLLKIAGDTAVDCGFLERGADPSWQFRCTKYCLRKRKPFFAEQWSPSMDSTAAKGMATDSTGNFYVVDFDSIGLHGDGKTYDDGYTLVRQCKLPLQIKRRKISCTFDNDPK